MLQKLIRERKKKLDALREAGRNPYPPRAKRDLPVAEVVGSFIKLVGRGGTITLAGRVRSFRDQGKIVFLDVDDGTGRIQAVLSAEDSHHFGFWKANLDIGDIIQVNGPLFRTKRGEKSIEVIRTRMLTKSLRPLPEKWHGIKDEEERLRKRYLDILFSPEVKEAVLKRSEAIRMIREFLWNEGFMEVETPMLQSIPGGALARPFKTHHNALSQDFFLRVAPELYLKRLLVAGFDKVFELGRDFRNEGIDRDHNPEFTMLEVYWAYQDYRRMIAFTKKLLKPLVKGSWKEVSYADAVKQHAGVGKDKLISMDPGAIDDLFKRKIRPKLVKPTILLDHLKSISPLAKSKEASPDFTERFQFIVDGTEIANGFSELNDPIDQRKRMEEQEKMYRKGEEATRMDEDFLEALEYGMPPAAGLGVGIDRVAAIYAGKHSIKDVIIFPTLKKKK